MELPSVYATGWNSAPAIKITQDNKRDKIAPSVTRALIIRINNNQPIKSSINHRRQSAEVSTMEALLTVPKKGQKSTHRGIIPGEMSWMNQLNPGELKRTEICN